MGPQGNVGATGAMGPAGPQGPAGATGATGPAGATGLTGPMGPQGPVGATGVMGPAGPQGPAGATGATGAAGPQGPTGATGATGAAGATGATGLAGPQGPTGATGATGAAGATGATGPAGSANMSGSTNYLVKFTGSTTGGNSLIQDNGTGTGNGTAPSASYQDYVYRSQLTANGDGQSTIYGFRTRDSQNDGATYGIGNTNNAITGYNFWGDLYTFGVHGASYGDYTRTGGVLGSVSTTSGWGSLGYKTSASTYFGVYGSSAYTSGGGFLANTERQGIGGGFYGGIIGSWAHGEIMGQVNSGELFASYNVGNELTSGYSADLVNTGSKRVAAYSVTSPELKVYNDGSAQLINGTAHVSFDRDFTAMIAGKKPTVTISPVGDCKGIHLVSIDEFGFTVAENGGGTASLEFNWIAVGKRVDSENATSLPEEITNNNFDSQMNEVMFNENNKEQSGKPIWWDGNKIRFDKAPEVKKEKKAEMPNK